MANLRWVTGTRIVETRSSELHPLRVNRFTQCGEASCTARRSPLVRGREPEPDAEATNSREHRHTHHTVRGGTATRSAVQPHEARVTATPAAGDKKEKKRERNKHALSEWRERKERDEEERGDGAAEACTKGTRTRKHHHTHTRHRYRREKKTMRN